ncbi:MAG: hypothetical protein HZC24_09580 [Rhodocyclales bacterium]|nr:hypothetical protein [Rhodocyclales bacterium]
MSQQINLYDPALLKKRELLTVANLAGLALVLLLAVGAWGGVARMELAALEAQGKVLAPQLKAQQEQVVQIGKQLAAAKPDPRLEAELTAARSLLAVRSEIGAALKKGVGAEAPSFAEFLRGLARQSLNGLWLTAFKVGENGANMEIRGRMLDPALLPEYIQRLSGEPAFKGRAFADLKVAPPQAAGQAAPAQAAPTAAAPFLEFMLIPAQSGAPEAGNAPPKLAAVSLGDLVPPEAARTLEKKR